LLRLGPKTGRKKLLRLGQKKNSLTNKPVHHEKANTKKFGKNKNKNEPARKKEKKEKKKEYS
jgi:hypothetical protein